ncbi:general secretion pathway protein GspB [Alteromonas sp. ASW11-19]|uniref:General secretion pathway protein GspB n=1 Tax=Alteromonas salexigens TaxID=2982530 RepID=A0ABT2VNG6_9ALTE|nr:general secretion pathway protein GspB [Alteromonas salexigens]MCU7554851.1 general secretion pathway protein GspB [Alteromonas salexigens]
MSERIAIFDVQPGMVITQVTQQNGPVKIQKSGLVSSVAMVQGLAEMGVQEVEIDPAQTVEIAPEVTTKTRATTQTQALLRGEHDTSARFDHALSDQFNRSLFLPTVQGLPSLWKVYTRQALTIGLLIGGGFAIGFTAATHTQWRPALSQLFSEPAPKTEVAVITPQPQSSEAESNNREPQDSTVNAGSESQPAQSASVSQQSEETADITSNANEQVAAAQRTKDQNQAQPEALSSGESPSSAQPDPEDEGTVLTQQQPDKDVSVSPELMARFNAAVEALDNKATDPAPEPETRVTVRDDTQRIDQLPVRLLTRLPTMNFSAHMYASRPRDRWVRVNGKQLGEGDWIADKVQIINIEAQQVVLAFEDEIFTMAALTDW